MSPSHGTETTELARWEQAHEWLEAFKRGPDAELTPERAEDFRRWIADEHNRYAFDRVEMVMRAKAHLRRRQVASRPERVADPYDPRISLNQWQAGLAGVGSRRRARVGLFAAAAASVFIAVRLMPLRSLPEVPEPHSYETKAGEQRQVRLEDGSLIFLSPQTELSASYTKSRRNILLTRGEALFEVAHDAARPFVVIAGGGSITAVGTAFDVKRDADRVVVTVTDGTVSVAPRVEAASEAGSAEGPGPNGTVSAVSSPRVTHGQRIAYDDSGSIRSFGAADTEAAIAWRHGRLQFDGEPLRYVVQAVNRYSRRQIIVDTAAGDFLYTGNVVPEHVDAWVGALPRIFPVKAVDVDDAHVLIQLTP